MVAEIVYAGYAFFILFLTKIMQTFWEFFWKIAYPSYKYV